MVGLKKTRIVPNGARSLTICEFISIQYQRVTDRQTDRQICRNYIVLCMLTRDKIYRTK